MVLEVNADTSSAELHKMQQLLKATLLMGNSPELRKAKKKLREMFPIEILTVSFPRL